MTGAGLTANVGATLAVRRGISAREKFLAVLYSMGPFVPSDAVVVLCGQDSDRRVAAVHALLQSGAVSNQVVLASGGRSEPPAILGATDVQKRLMGMGWPRDRVHLETASQNTREQAVNCVREITEFGWKRVHLVASTYHLPRVVLTFVKALDEAGSDVRLIPLAAESPWTEAPVGLEDARLALFAGELQKVDEYADHVATWERGLAYLLGGEK